MNEKLIIRQKSTHMRLLDRNSERKNVSFCCLQETEVPAGYPEKVLNCGNYNLELELNDNCSVGRPGGL